MKYFEAQVLMLFAKLQDLRGCIFIFHYMQSIRMSNPKNLLDLLLLSCKRNCQELPASNVWSQNVEAKSTLTFCKIGPRRPWLQHIPFDLNQEHRFRCHYHGTK